jgi:hypothetical protein
VVDGEIVAAVQDDRVAVGAVELCDGVAALDVSRVAGGGDDVVDDDVFGEQVEEVLAVGEAVESLLDDSKNGSSALKSSRSLMVVIMRSFYAQACAVRRAKSAKLIGGAPVTFWTSLLGREPWPVATVSVSVRSTSP